MSIYTITQLTVDEGMLLRASEFKQEREQIITDILNENQFIFKTFEGPYKIHISFEENKLLLEVKSRSAQHRVDYSLTNLRRFFRDYNIVCESYMEAVKTADPRKIEAIDMGRRGLHNEGAELLRETIEEQIELDHNTARYLFRLLYVLHKT